MTRPIVLLEDDDTLGFEAHRVWRRGDRLGEIDRVAIRIDPIAEHLGGDPATLRDEGPAALGLRGASIDIGRSHGDAHDC